MYLTYQQYTDLGYNAIPEAAFSRWEAHAEQLVRNYTNNSITDATVTEINQRGICEIMDALYKSDKVLLGSEGGQPVTGFSNQKYSESYAAPKDVQALADNTIQRILQVYFTQEQRRKWAWA
jgi:hypothetical protein